MAQPKVYEFAKEIGVETITLMDNLRKWEIPVKSHMAALSPEDISKIKEKMAEEDAKPKSSKKVAKKKAKTTAKKKTAAKKKTVAKKKTKAAKKVVRKKSDAKAIAKEEEDKAAGSSRKIIRRKAGAAQQAEKAIEAAAQQKAKAAAEAAAKEAEEKAKAEALEAEAGQEEGTEVAATEVAETAEAQAETAPEDTKTEAAAEEKPVEKSAKEKRQDKRKGKILGRVDLSKIKPPSAGKSRPAGGRRDSSEPRVNVNLDAPGDAKPGSRSTAPRMKAVDMSKDGRGDKNASGKKKSLKGADEQTKLLSEEVSFNRTEFRKREIVFQPKKRMTDLGRAAMQTEITKPKASKRVVKVHGTMTVAELAGELKVKVGKLVGFLMKQGIQARQNDSLDFETISLIVPEFDHEAVNTYKTVEEKIELSAEVESKDLVPRAPVVTVMGHVDHGKTSILDAIRKTNVTSGEAGGITQHIGAYRVKLPSGEPITFLDTPGHAAFTQMRARGASVTDVAVIVVAADDGLMPQTQEAINHAKAAGVPIIVAVNKMDRPNANPDKIKQQLTEFELIPEEWGGSTMFIETVAIEGKGIPELLEAIHLQAEMLELKANPKRSMKGVVIESKVQKGRGVVATVLVHDGTLNKGDYVVAGTAYGRVRAMLDDQAKQMKSAGPGVPVEILGLNSTPKAGDEVNTTKKERQAEEIANQRLEEEKAKEFAVKSPKMSLEDLFSGVVATEVKELPIVLKTDVAGSAEAIRNLFANEKSEKVKIKVVHHAVGGITESDILLASTAGALVIGFNVGAEGSASSLAKKEGVQIKRYSIIYELADDMRKAMKGLLDPDIVEEAIGAAEVREIFKVPGIGTIGGCMVTDGKVTADALVRVYREGKKLYEGNLSSLRRFKDHAKEVAQGYECGIGVENYNDLKVGDTFEFFVNKEVEAEL